MKFTSILFISLIISVLSCTQNIPEITDNNEYTVCVIVNYGDLKESKVTDISIKQPLTALEALQYTSVVETHPVGKYVFVSSIDSVQNIRDAKAWYYKVNGESPGVLAINNKLNNGDTIHWIYKKDVCSHTVDN